MNARQLIAPALSYFALVFGAGFVLGTVRVFWVAPQLGTRAAELAEAPVMLVVIFFAARWIAKRFAVRSSATIRLSRRSNRTRLPARRGVHGGALAPGHHDPRIDRRS